VGPRDELYKEVWSVPMWTLAKKYGISDVGLAKVCRKLTIPLLGRAYWARKRAGQKVSQDPLPDIKEKDKQEIERTMRDEVLETRKYPEIVFKSNNISLSRAGEGRYRARVIGDLNLHGVTQKNVWINGEVTVTGEGMRAKGEFSIKQTDYKIKAVSVAGGTLKIKNELKCSFDILARSVR